MPDDGFHPLRFTPPHITEVDLVVEPTLPKVRLIALGLGVFLHGGHRGGLVVVVANVHALDAQSLLPREELHRREGPGRIRVSFKTVQVQ